MNISTKLLHRFINILYGILNTPTACIFVLSDHFGCGRFGCMAFWLQGQEEASATKLALGGFRVSGDAPKER
jgi:hypothetical protein